MVAALALALAAIIAGTNCLVIEELVVPEVVRNGSETRVVLDCKYAFNKSDTKDGLVVRWYLNDNQVPVYQWIPDQRPQDLGVLKGRLNLDHKASEEKENMYRALEIINPTPDLSGTYRCHVATYDSEVSNSKKMIVFVPEKKLDIRHERQGDAAVNVTCAAEGVFPEPQIAFFTDQRPVTEDVTVMKSERDGVYDITAWRVAPEDTLNNPTHFSCQLSIPEANYTNTVFVQFVPDVPTTVSTFGDENLSLNATDGLTTTGAASCPLVSAWLLAVFSIWLRL